MGEGGAAGGHGLRKELAAGVSDGDRLGVGWVGMSWGEVGGGSSPGVRMG